tara:strand:+ start:950 stop:2701 length:1752 start_codon:yes stop_codon:yes gene_type:complete
LKQYFLFLLVIFSVELFSQGDQRNDSLKYLVQVNFENAPKKFDSKKLSLPKQPVEGYNLEREKSKILNQVYASGFIEAELTESNEKNTIRYSIDLGKPYKWKNLNPGNVDEGVLSKIGYRDKLYLNQPLSFGEVRKLFKNVITHYENNGYPFASIRLDSVELTNNEVSANLYIEKNKKVTIDTIKILGSVKLSRKYILNYIGIKQKDLYNEKQIREIETRMKELPFVTSIRPSEVDFYADRTSLTIYINHKKANYFDGIIGFLPDDNTGELLITGDLKIQLKNALGKGEDIELNWKRLRTQTQEIYGRLRVPFLFNTPFGAEGSIKIYRRDTTFNTVTTNLSLQYIFRGGDYVEVFWEQDQSNLISTYNLDIATELPEHADVRNNSFGLGGKVNELDYRLNPRSGFDFEARAGFGNREIRQNPAINPEVYDSLVLKSNSYKGTGKLRFFIPLLSRQTVLIGAKSGFIINNELFTNELFRIGGLHTLRGFDEESIFASSYVIGTFEYRFLLEQNSFLSVFYEQAWYENQVGNTLITDTPFGFGAGISFETNIGIFSLNYALGKQFNNPILFRASKIHFGFVNYF